MTPNPAFKPISLGLGEPRHATPQLIADAMMAAITRTPSGLASYPATAGEPALREAFAQWLTRRYSLQLDPATQMLPVLGSREALFALAQTVVNRPANAADPKPLVVCPNPFYQIYEGAALLSGAEPYYVASDPARNFAPDWASVPAAVWQRTQLLIVCSPGNPTGAVMPLSEWQMLFELSDQFGFVIGSDECYSEIYFRDEPPLSGLQAAAQLGRHDFKNLIALTSLSKRSNVPGMRSGFVSGDAALIKSFLLYRTYHGSAMSPVVQAASIAAWQDEDHVVENRALYRTKFAQVTPCSLKCSTWPCRMPASTCGLMWLGTMPPLPGSSMLTTMSRCCRAAFWPAPRRAATLVWAASVWHWWPTPPSALKPPNALSNLSKPAKLDTSQHHSQLFLLSSHTL